MSNTNANNNEFTENDWKLFRKYIGNWQENYMNKLNQEYIALLSQDKTSSEKFWELNKRIYKDKKGPGVILETKRSSMVTNIIFLLEDKVICMNDLNDFSDTLKETIRAFIK